MPTKLPPGIAATVAEARWWLRECMRGAPPATPAMVSRLLEALLDAEQEKATFRIALLEMVNYCGGCGGSGQKPTDCSVCGGEYVDVAVPEHECDNGYVDCPRCADAHKLLGDPP